MLHIQKFLDRIRAADNRQQRDVIMTVQEARDLHADITRLLLRLEQLSDADTSPETVVVEVRGASF